MNRKAQPRKRVAVLGDIHANLEALEAVLADAQDQGCDRHACLGDVVGYNANPAECVNIVRRMNMTCVKGNHDDFCSTDDSLPGVSLRAVAAVEWTRRQLGAEDKAWLRGLRMIRMVGGFTLVHATLDNPGNWGYVFDHFAAAASLYYQTTSVCFHGHTHVPHAFVRDGTVRGGFYTRFRLVPGQKYFINVGSVGEPRDGDPRAAYVIFDQLEQTIELRRVEFDRGETDRKVAAAGLPPRQRATNK